MSTGWYYNRDGKQHGPISGAQLKKLAEAGRIDPSNEVWKEDSQARLPAGRVKGLFPHVEKPPAPEVAVPKPPAAQKTPAAPPANEPRSPWYAMYGRKAFPHEAQILSLFQSVPKDLELELHPAIPYQVKALRERVLKFYSLPDHSLIMGFGGGPVRKQKLLVTTLGIHWDQKTEGMPYELLDPDAVGVKTSFFSGTQLTLGPGLTIDVSALQKTTAAGLASFIKQAVPIAKASGPAIKDLIASVREDQERMRAYDEETHTRVQGLIDEWKRRVVDPDPSAYQEKLTRMLNKEFVDFELPPPGTQERKNMGLDYAGAKSGDPAGMQAVAVARDMQGRGDHAGIVKQLQHVVRRPEVSKTAIEAASFYLGMAKFHLGDFEGALHDLANASTLGDSQFIAPLYRARANAALGRINAARVEYEFVANSKLAASSGREQIRELVPIARAELETLNRRSQ